MEGARGLGNAMVPTEKKKNSQRKNTNALYLLNTGKTPS